MELKIVSGGQTGIDQLALTFASLNGLRTGGIAPYNYMTEDGPSPDLAKFNVTQDEYIPDLAKAYSNRTSLNILNSDYTVIIALGKKSPGTKLTINRCKQNDKPFIIVDELSFFSIDDIINDIKKHNSKVINFAGPRGSKLSGNETLSVSKFLDRLFKLFKTINESN